MQSWKFNASVGVSILWGYCYNRMFIVSGKQGVSPWKFGCRDQRGRHQDYVHYWWPGKYIYIYILMKLEVSNQSCIWGMFHLKIHRISPGWLSTALLVLNYGQKAKMQNYYIDFFARIFSATLSLQLRCICFSMYIWKKEEQ